MCCNVNIYEMSAMSLILPKQIKHKNWYVLRWFKMFLVLMLVQNYEKIFHNCKSKKLSVGKNKLRVNLLVSLCFNLWLSE